jgi:hypothetical protein
MQNYIHWCHERLWPRSAKTEIKQIVFALFYGEFCEPAAELVGRFET